MNACVKAVPNGQVGCISAIARATHIGLLEWGQSFSSFDNALNLNEWRQLIQEDLKLFIFKKSHDWSNNTPDPAFILPEISQTNIMVSKSNLQYLFYLQSNFCDFKDVMNSIGVNANFHVIYFLEDGSIMMVDDGEGAVGAFDALVSAISKGSQKELQNSFPLYVNHSKYADLENALLLTPEWTVDDLLAYVPSGYSIRATGAYSTSTGEIEVQINERCGDGVSGLTTTEIVVVRSNVDTPAVTTVAAVSGKTGRYTLTLEKTGTPAPMEQGDEMVIQVKVVSTSVITHISNEFKVIVK